MAKKKTRVLLPGGIQGLVHDLQNGTQKSAPRTLNEEENAAEKENNPDTVQPADNEQQTAATTSQRPQRQSAPYQNAQPSANQTDRVNDERPSASSSNPAENGLGGQRAVYSSENAPSQSTSEQVDQPSPTPQQNFSASQQSYSVSQQSYSAPQQPSPTPQEPAQGTAVQPAADEQRGRGRRPKENTMKEYHIVKDDSKDSWQLFLDMAKQYRDGGGKLATIYIDGTLKNVLDRMKYAGPEKLSTSAILSSIVARFIYDHEDDIRRALFSGDLI